MLRGWCGSFDQGRSSRSTTHPQIRRRPPKGFCLPFINVRHDIYPGAHVRRRAPPIESSGLAGTKALKDLGSLRRLRSSGASGSTAEQGGTRRFLLPFTASIGSLDLGSCDAASRLGCRWRVARGKRHLQFLGKLPVLFLLRLSTLVFVLGFSVSLWFGHLVLQSI